MVSFSTRIFNSAYRVGSDFSSASRFFVSANKARASKYNFCFSSFVALLAITSSNRCAVSSGLAILRCAVRNATSPIERPPSPENAAPMILLPISRSPNNVIPMPIPMRASPMRIKCLSDLFLTSKSATCSSFFPNRAHNGSRSFSISCERSSSTCRPMALLAIISAFFCSIPCPSTKYVMILFFSVFFFFACNSFLRSSVSVAVAVRRFRAFSRVPT